MVSTGSVKSSESFKEMCSLGWGNESQSLDSLGGMGSSSLDNLGGVRVSSSGVLQSLGSLVVGFVVNKDIVLSSERFS